MKNQAPDFFHMSLCSAQILHNHTKALSLPSAPGLEGFPIKAEVNNEVMEEDNEDDDDNEAFRLRLFDCPGPGAKQHSLPHFPQVIFPHSAHLFCE